MPFVTPPATLAIAANRVATTFRRPGARPVPARPRRLGDLEVCTQQQQAAITLAIDTIKVVYLDTIRYRYGDWETLANTMQMRSVANITISCNVCYGGPNPYATSNFTNQSLQVCDGFNNRLWLEQLILTELVRLSGGTDLDAYAVKNYLFRIDKTSPPWVYYPLNNSEKNAMCAGGVRQPPPWSYLAGKYTVWDNVGGKLWPSTRPAGSTSVLPYGPSLIASNIPYWQHPC